ncbi:hypothetical protein HAX54_037398 [Datura stramonium]|uniref:Protein kish n=1 Tax=Datura stramonium TaxID=4076 RepID=A0ABS8SGV0_DATST|nr:hypothetical protein [Datura stramonium]
MNKTKGLNLRKVQICQRLNFHSFLTVVLLWICTCTYVKLHFPALLEQRTGFRGFFWKAARIGGADESPGWPWAA